MIDRPKLSRYWPALLILALALAYVVLGAILRSPKADDPNLLVTMPGRTTIELAQGRYRISYAHLSSSDEHRTDAMRNAGLRCGISGETADVTLTLDADRAMRSMSDQQGESLWWFDVPQTDRYVIACDGTMSEPAQLAINKLPQTSLAVNMAIALLRYAPLILLLVSVVVVYLWRVHGLFLEKLEQPREGKQ